MALCLVEGWTIALFIFASTMMSFTSQNVHLFWRGQF